MPLSPQKRYVLVSPDCTKWGHLQEEREPRFSVVLFLAPSFMLLITKGYTQLLLKLSLLHH